MFCHWRRKVFNVGEGGGLSIDRIIGGGGRRGRVVSIFDRHLQRHE